MHLHRCMQQREAWHKFLPVEETTDVHFLQLSDPTKMYGGHQEHNVGGNISGTTCILGCSLAPTNIARVNLVVGCSKRVFFHIHLYGRAGGVRIVRTRKALEQPVTKFTLAILVGCRNLMQCMQQYLSIRNRPLKKNQPSSPLSSLEREKQRLCPTVLLVHIGIPDETFKLYKRNKFMKIKNGDIFVAF